MLVSHQGDIDSVFYVVNDLFYIKCIPKITKINSLVFTTSRECPLFQNLKVFGENELEIPFPFKLAFYKCKKNGESNH